MTSLEDSSDSSLDKILKILTHYFSPKSFPFLGVILTTHVVGKYPKKLFLLHSRISLVKSYNMGISGASEVPRLISIRMSSTSDNYVCSMNIYFFEKFLKLVGTN